MQDEGIDFYRTDLYGTVTVTCLLYTSTLAQLAFLPLGAGQQNGTGPGALIGADNLFLFHLVHDAGRTGIAQLAACLLYTSADRPAAAERRE